MEQYIDKADVVAKIKNLIERAEAERVLYPKTILAAKNYLLIEDYKKLLSIIDTLEVKEVDLDKELESFIEHRKAWVKDNWEVEYNNGDSFNHIYDLKDIARHFYELGLKAQIMTSKLQQRIGVLKMGFWTGLQTFEETEMALSDAYNQGIDDILEELGLKAQKGE